MKVFIIPIMLSFIAFGCNSEKITDTNVQQQEVITLQKYADYPRLFARFYFDVTFDEQLSSIESRYLHSVLENPDIVFAKYYKLSNIGLMPQKSVKYLRNDTVMNFIATQKINLPKTDCSTHSFSKTRQWIGQFSNSKKKYKNVLKIGRIHVDSIASSYVSEIYINLGDVKGCKYSYATNMDKNDVDDIYKIFIKRRDASFYCGCMDSIIVKKKFKYLKKEEFLAEEDRTEWRN